MTSLSEQLKDWDKLLDLLKNIKEDKGKILYADIDKIAHTVVIKLRIQVDHVQ